MAKLTDKFYNRIIEGQLELDASEQAEQDASAVKAVEGASAGTIDKALGLSSQGKLVKGDFPSELPDVTGNEGKFLKVNSGATGVEWGSVSGGTQLYKHTFSASLVNMVSGDTISIIPADFYYVDKDSNNPTLSNILSKLAGALILHGTVLLSNSVHSIISGSSTNLYLLKLADGTLVSFPSVLNQGSSSLTGAETTPL